MVIQSVGKPYLHFVQGRIALADFTPEFQIGLFFENGVKPPFCHFHAFQLSLEGFIILYISYSSSAKLSANGDLLQRRH
jgi:hypothetical protein